MSPLKCCSICKNRFRSFKMLNIPVIGLVCRKCVDKMKDNASFTGIDLHNFKTKEVK